MQSTHVFSLSAVLAAVLCCAAPAHAQLADDFEAASTAFDPEFRNARSLGMGGAFTGAGNGLGALYHNPAGILTVGVYELNLGYQRTFGTEGNAFGIGIADAKTNSSIAAAFNYSFAFGRDDSLQAAFDAAGDTISEANSRFRDHNIRGALAFPIVPQRIAVGVGVHYVHATRGTWEQSVTQQIEVPILDSDGEPTGDTETQTQITTEEFAQQHQGLTLDAGIFALVSEQLSVGFAARNILKIDGWQHGRRLEAGLGGHFDSFHFEAGWFAEQDEEDKFQNGVNVGIEYVVATAPVRLGYRYDAAVGEHFIASGAGFRSEKVGVDIGFEQNMTDRSERRLVGALSVYF